MNNEYKNTFRIICMKIKFLTMKGNLPHTFINPHIGKPQAQKNKRPEHIQNAGLFLRFTYLGVLNNS